MILTPSEYEGQPTTCVVGRVVLTRGPLVPERRNQPSETVASGSSSKGKSAGKGRKNKPTAKAEAATQKAEVHLLGGATVDEILFIEAWADGAQQLAQALQRGKVYRIAGAKKIDSSPRFSTSRLPYFLRFVPPLGVGTKIVLCEESPWSDLPLHHPFTDFETLQGVGDSLRVGLLGVVETQPGLVSRDTKHGPHEVCNAVLRQGVHLIRCAFWRDSGRSLAQHPVGTPLALHQVTVVFKNHGWEVAATEATLIEDCPEELRETLQQTTDLREPGVTLTKAGRVDYETVKAKPATLSGLASVIQPNQARQLDGVFEVHSVAVLGVVSVLGSGGFQMRACAKCKANVREEFTACQLCLEDSGFEHRWIFSLELADQAGACDAMLFHDAASKLPFLTGDSNEANARMKIIKGFRTQPWSVRVVFRTQDLKQTNHLEIKTMTTTLTPEGVVASFRVLPAAQAPSMNGCPFAKCSSVSFNRGLGVLTVGDTSVAAVRLLVRVQAPEEDETVGTPDPGNVGFRVCRRVKCCLAQEGDESIYELKTAGAALAVQWLLTAPGDSCFLVTAKGRGADCAFNVLAYQEAKTVVFDDFVKLMNLHVQHKTDVLVSHGITDTPTKRLEALAAAVPEATTPPPFNKRQKLE